MFMVFRFFLAALRLLLLLLYTFFTLLIALPVFYVSGKSRTVSYATARYWGRGTLFILNVKVKLSGTIPPGKVLIMPNHQTFLDVLIMLAYYPASIVAKKEIASWPLIKHAVELGRMILVDRGSLKGSLQTMDAIAEEVKCGGSVILFPEGGAYAGPLTRAFKSGSFKIAEQTQTPIVPVAIKYLDRDMAWADESFIHNYFMKMGFWTIRVDVWFADPVIDADFKTLMHRTKSLIDSHLS